MTSALVFSRYNTFQTRGQAYEIKFGLLDQTNRKLRNANKIAPFRVTSFIDNLLPYRILMRFCHATVLICRHLFCSFLSKILFLKVVFKYLALRSVPEWRHAKQRKGPCVTPWQKVSLLKGGKEVIRKSPNLPDVIYKWPFSKRFNNTVNIGHSIA